MAAKYLNSLVSYILDTKPYHSKLSEVVEEYLFEESMTVNIVERLFSNTTIKAAWPYTFFSGGPSSGRTMPLKRVLHNSVRGPWANNQTLSRGAFKAFRDEIAELPGVGFTFDPTSIQGIGIKDVVLQRTGNTSRVEPMLEGHDFFLSHGAYTFQILKTRASNVIGTFIRLYEDDDGPFPITVTMPFMAPGMEVFGPAVQVTSNQISVTAAGWVRVFGVQEGPRYAPEFIELRDKTVISDITAFTQQRALDFTQPGSSLNLITELLDQIETELPSRSNITPTLLTQANAEIAKLRAVLADDRLPSTYEALLRPLHVANVGRPSGFNTWYAEIGVDGSPDVGLKFAELTPGLYFNAYTDVAMRRNGALRYDDVRLPDLSITNIVADPERATYEEFTLTAVTDTFFTVTGSASGLVGSFTIGEMFSSPYLSFSTSGTNFTPGASVLLTPAEQITVHAKAPLEQWSLIKVNPLAYSRPMFNSTRVGYLQSATNQIGRVTILDSTFPDGTLVIRMTSSTAYTVRTTGDPLYAGSGTVGTLYNDGRVSFRVMAGSAYTYAVNDVFYVEITNPVATPVDLDLVWGYDVEPYSDDTLQYTSPLFPAYLETLDFGFNGRFIGYDFDALGLTLTQTVSSGGAWRIRALPDTSAPITPLGLDPSIQLWYANRFALERHNGNDWIVLDSNVPIGTPYNNSTYGIAFTIVPAAKPFIASRVTYSNGTDGPFTAEGGDAFTFTVDNDGAFQQDPAGLTSGRVPRLVMHGDSYQTATPASWTLTFTSTSAYTLQGVYTAGPNTGASVFTTPVSLLFGNGRSYQNAEHGLHWTVLSGSSIGHAAGDTYTFETYQSKPSYLVHGSVSGWQAPAELDKWYWNGKIGFKLKKPTVKFINPAVDFAPTPALQRQGDSPFAVTVPVTGTLTLNSVRPDTKDHVYVARSNATNRWTLYRDGTVVGTGSTTVADQFISVTLPNAPIDTEFRIWVENHEPDLFMGNDLAIIKASPGRMPTSADFIVIERTRSDDVGIAIRSISSTHETTLQQLEPLTIDVRYVDLNANSGVPLSSTSPEVTVLSGWLPMIVEDQDTSAGSTAVFSDASTRTRLLSASTGEVIGTIASTSTNPNSPVFLTWDTAFYNKYLPLNAEANVVTYGSGTNENVHVTITEGIRFLLSGGSQTESALFSDELKVNFRENTNWLIRSTYDQALTVQIKDSPFGGFLPGYDNTGYDFETGIGDVSGLTGGSYDMGFPLQSWFERAKFLSVQSTLTPQEQDELNTLITMLNGSLVDGQIEATTLDDFIKNTTPAITVRAATTANITLSGLQTIDGISLVAGDLVLVKSQTTTSQNGVYIVASGAWTRHPDYNIAAELNNTRFIAVSQGTVNGDSWWWRVQPFVSYTYQVAYSTRNVGFGLPQVGMAMSIEQRHEKTGCELIDLTRAGFSVLSGNGALFTNGTSEFGPTIAIASQNTSTIATIEKNLIDQKLLQLRVKVKLDALNADDGGTIALSYGANGLLVLNPAREATFDAARRPYVSYRPSTSLSYTNTVVFPTALVVGRWYQFEFYRDGSNFVCRVTDLDTSVHVVTTVGSFNSSFQGPLFTSTSAGGSAGFVGGPSTFGGGVFVAINNGSGGFATSSTFKRSADFGQTWQTITTGLTALQNWDIRYAAGAFVVVTGVASADRGVYRSIDGGLTWTLNTTALPASGFWYAYGSNGSRLLAARWGSNQLAVSDNGGASWTTRTLPASLNWYGMIFVNGRWLLSSRSNRSIYRSDDNGETWSLLSTVPGSGTLAQLITSNGKAFIRNLGSPDANMWVSDDGSSWTTVTLPFSSGGSPGAQYFEPGGYWYLFRGNSTGLVAISTDTVNWQLATNTVPFSTAFSSSYGGGTIVVHDFPNNQTARAVLDNFSVLEEPLVNRLSFTADSNGVTTAVSYSDVVLCSEEDSTAAVGVDEGITVIANDLGYAFATDGFDVGELDARQEIYATVISVAPTPLPSAGLPPGGTLYENFQTPLYVSMPARIIDLSFNVPLGGTPTVYYWAPGTPAPIQVSLLETLTPNRVFRFTVPSPTEMKIIAV
jgi:hypothetical protein